MIRRNLFSSRIEELPCDRPEMYYAVVRDSWCTVIKKRFQLIKFRVKFFFKRFFVKPPEGAVGYCGFTEIGEGRIYLRRDTFDHLEK